MMNTPRRIVVVGGVAAGASAATKARRTDEGAEITIFERGPYVSFANCGLPYYVGGEIQDVESLLQMTPKRFAERFRIQVDLRHEVTGIDRGAHQVEVRDVQTGDTRLVPYDKLVLAPGGRPVMPPIPGIERPGVFSLTTVPDAQAVREWIAKTNARRGVVIGGGFIGLEAVEALLNLGLEVHLVEKLPQVMPLMDPEMAGMLETHLAERGVRLHLGAEVVGFSGDTDLAGIELGSGETLSADVALVAIGVRPELTLAREAGLEIGASGGISVDDRMLSSDPDIYACGDAVEVVSRITGKRVRVPLAGPANKEGRVAGANAAGGDLRFPGVIGTSIVRVCDLTAGKTGLGEREARAEGFDPLVAYVHATDHAGYYPGAREMTVKLMADRESGRVLGAQIVGPKGVDKRIDVIATAIYGNMTVEDLEGLDLAYAPPYSSAKDPVILAGFVAANQWRKEVETVSPAEVAARMSRDESVRLLDVRTPEEYAAGRIPGAQHVPLDELRSSLDKIQHGGPIVVYCAGGYRSYHACKILAYHGHTVMNLNGGFISWSREHPKLVEVD